MCDGMSMSIQEHGEFEDLKKQVGEIAQLRASILKAVRDALLEADIPKLREAIETMDVRVRKLEKRAPKPERAPMPPTPPPKILRDTGLAAEG